MAQEQFEDEGPEPSRHGGGRVVAAGVVGACILGVSLGLWARPVDHEQMLGGPQPVQAESPEPPGQRLQIVIDDAPPAPLGAPLEVLPAQGLEAQRATSVLAPPDPEPVEPVAPRRAPAGLMKVDAPAAAAVVPPLKREPAKPKRVEPRVEKAAAATTAPRKVPAEKTAMKVVEHPKPRPNAEKAILARAPKPNPAKAKPAQIAKLTPVKAETRARARDRQVTLVHAVKPETPKRRIEVKATRRDAPKATRIAVRQPPKPALRAPPRTIKASAPKPIARPTPRPAKPALHGEGPLRMVRNTCGSSDPIVCADPRLSVRERQLQAAYHQAEAAGVNPEQLRRQQQRWLAARAAAAREAPWAVEEVYEARIAELNDQSRGPD